MSKADEMIAQKDMYFYKHHLLLYFRILHPHLDSSVTASGVHLHLVEDGVCGPAQTRTTKIFRNVKHFQKNCTPSFLSFVLIVVDDE